MRPHLPDTIALLLAAASAAIGIASDTRAFVPILAVTLVAGGLARAQVAPQLALWMTTPLCLLIGIHHHVFGAAGLCLGAAAAVWSWLGHRRAGEAGDAIRAVRFVSAATIVLISSALLAFVIVFR